MQRSRWQRGAVENVAATATRATARYWVQQISIGYGIIALNAYLFLLVTITLLAAAGSGGAVLDAIGMIFVIERVVTRGPPAGEGG